MSTFGNNGFKSDKHPPTGSGSASDNRIPFGFKDGDLAVLFAQTYLQGVWDPGRFLQLFRTEKELKNALKEIERRPDGRAMVRALKKNAKTYHKEWSRTLARDD